MQSIRRYYDDTTKFHPHIINAGKYFSVVVALFFNYLDIRIVGGGKPYAQWNWARTVWLIVNIISSFYKFAYDILMDW